MNFVRSGLFFRWQMQLFDPISELTANRALSSDLCSQLDEFDFCLRLEVE